MHTYDGPGKPYWHVRKRARDTWWDCLKTATSTPFTANGSPSCPRTSSWPGEYEENARETTKVEECGAGGLPCSHRGVPTKGTFVVVSIGDTNVDTATESVRDHPDGVAHS